MADRWSTKDTLTTLWRVLPKETPFTILEAAQAMHCTPRMALQRLTSLCKKDRLHHLGPGLFSLMKDQSDEAWTPQYDEEDLEHKQWVLAILQTKQQRKRLAQLHALSRI